MITDAQKEYFLKSRSNIGQLDTIEIYHPNFSQRYYLVRNHLKGFTATLENGEQQFFSYMPMQISKGAIKDDLDQSLTVTLGDVRDTITKELELVRQARGFSTKPVLTYRSYKSDDFTRPLMTAVQLEVTDFQFLKKGVSFEAKAQSLNVNKTGEKYDKTRFPMLAGVT